MNNASIRPVPADWDGLACLQELPDGWSRPYRVDPTGQDMELSPGLWERIEVPVGARGRWSLSGEGVWHLPVRVRGEQATVDARIGDRLDRHQLTTGDHQVTVPIDGPDELEVWLPNNGQIDLGVPGVSGTAAATAVAPTGPRWLAYGSSITQAGGAAGPTQTWPALVAQRYGWRLWSLGFGGQCHLDPVVADRLATAEAELISLCIGINIYGNGSFNARSLGPQLEGFVRRIRQRRPTTPIALTTPIVSPAREETSNSAGWTLAEVRAEVERVGRSLIGRGDDQLHLVDGLRLLTADDMSGPLSADGLHPNTEGYRQLAEAVGPSLAGLLDG